MCKPDYSNISMCNIHLPQVRERPLLSILHVGVKFMHWFWILCPSCFNMNKFNALLAASVVMSLCIASGGEKPLQHNLPTPASKPLRVLLISMPLWGHVTPLLAVAEELVLRGHEVTFCLGVDEGNNAKFEEKFKGYGIKYYRFHSDVILKMEENHDAPFYKKVFVVASGLFAKYSGKLLHRLNESLSDGSFDIVLGNDFLIGALKCVEHGYSIPSMLIGSTSQALPHHHPRWSWPSFPLGAASDYLSFLQRMVSALDKSLLPLFVSYVFMLPFKSAVEEFCPGVTLSELSFSSGISFPHIVPLVIGFEYARTLFPLTEYVGPLLSRSPPPLSEEMAEWLAGRPDRSVVYVSMGTLSDLTKESSRAIVEGVMKTNYSLLWSLRKSNQWVLEGLEVDPGRVLISDWTPQFSVLASTAIHSAILHGGLNGLNEALWNGVPVMGLPQMNEQAVNMGRVAHNELGLLLSEHTLTSSIVTDAIAAMDARDYRKNVQQLQKMFRFAGGVKKAADLVEHYSEVGYAHLVPSYVKYRWNWIQYYNADVYLVLLLVLGVAVVCFVATVKCVCVRCCRNKQKKD